MKCIELNSVGDFDRWDQAKLDELRNLGKNQSGPDNVIYQNQSYKLSFFGLEPYERLPFRIMRNSFDLICLSGGLAISSFSNGGISLIMYDKGEHVHHTLGTKEYIHDVQNIGRKPLVMAIIEYSADQELVEI
ncbi:hypothetical protein [Allomuricauda sp. M10]|uniref:hypothetical protein n=1 Tax=Allomuricauda sp. M10 TaxID=2683292 RepID=UPI001D18D6A3|nr:hypothetical protein [Muricauda sp. M10]